MVRIVCGIVRVNYCYCGVHRYVGSIVREVFLVNPAPATTLMSMLFSLMKQAVQLTIQSLGYQRSV